jgi:Squalene-hopene cyclase C-terminal domain
VIPLAVLLGLTLGQEPAPLRTRADAEAALQAGVTWLLDNQNEDGSWGHWTKPGPYDGFWSNPETHRSWQVATTALGCMALMDAGLGEREAAACDRGLDFLAREADVKRPSDWDTDNVWAYAYGLCGLSQAAEHPRYHAETQRERAHAIAMMGQRMLTRLHEYQTPNGGWSYYDEEVKTKPPMWATSFTTAVVVIGMLQAERLGWPVERKRIVAALNAIEHCRLPSGAYSYTVDAIPNARRLDDIDQVKGSLSRIQSCNLALFLAARAGYGTLIQSEAQLAAGLEPFFRDHRFLDAARGRPHPHEAYYYNSGYFYFFGHYYAGWVIEMLPPEDRVRWAPELWRHVLKTQARDGSSLDYFMNSFGRPYGTAYAVSALARSLRLTPVESVPEAAAPNDR